MSQTATGRLAEKIALITGAASGIGWAAAERFAQEGATVILGDRAGDKLQERLSTLRADAGRHCAITFDVTSEQDWKRTVQEIDAMFGRLDVLVNNAGYGYFQSIEAMTFRYVRTLGLAVQPSRSHS